MNKDFEKEYGDWNREKHYELLNYDKKYHLKLLNKQGNKFNLQLLTYSTILIGHLHWEIRDQYLELLENYKEKKIDTRNFRIRFSERYESIEKVADILESNRVLLSPDKNSLNFGNLIEEINDYWEVYSNDPEPFRNKFEIGEIELRTSIEKIYFRIQKYFDEE